MDRPLRTVQRELRASDLAAVRAQLGREPTTPFTVVARCSATDGVHPLVIRNAPVDAAGDPFPTTFWLTCPETNRSVSRLESAGWIAKLNERAEADEAFAAGLEAAHRRYAEERAEELPDAVAWGGVGGTRRGIKCLHAHYAYRIAGGDDPVGAWVAERIEPVHGEPRRDRVAAIDQGTSSCRLLVVEPSEEPGAEPAELARDLVITRLGRGVDRTGRLEPDRIDRTLEVLGHYVRRARALGAGRIRVAATSAVRDAANREAFLGPVRALVGADPEVVDGTHEAALSFLGATKGLDPAGGPYLVLDIGGGSTEVVVGDPGGQPDHSISMQIGSVRLTERHIRSDPPSDEDLLAIREDAEQAMAAAPPVVGNGARAMVGVAGTATTLQAIALGLDRYDPERIHRSRLGLADVERVTASLARMTNEERAAIPVMTPGRGDVIVAGAVILAAAMRTFGFESTLVSETDILDGLAAQMLTA